MHKLILAGAFLLLLVAVPVPASAANTQASISGVIWEDLNMDGQRQAGEPGLERVFITLYGATSTTISTTTDGSYNFPSVAPGAYRLEIGPAGNAYLATYPAKV